METFTIARPAAAMAHCPRASGLLVLLDSLEDEDNAGVALGVEILRTVSLRGARCRHANGPLVTLQLVNAVLLFPLLSPGLVQKVDGLGIFRGIDAGRGAVLPLGHLARGLAVSSHDEGEVRD